MLNKLGYEKYLRDKNFKKLGQYIFQIYINSDERIKQMYQKQIDDLLIIQKDLCQKINYEDLKI